MVLVLDKASEHGYVFSEKEKALIRDERKWNSSSSFVAEYGGLEVFNPQQIPGLSLSDEEHREICENTIGKVLSKL